jgi:hypothetical protein
MRSFINCIFSSNIIRQLKARRMRWAEHVSRHGRGAKSVQGFGGKI